ncbi:MAG: HRDC domain-containing protein [Pseudomonadota bacterium]
MHVVNTATELADVCARLTACTELSIDTEFVRERTFFAKLCLLQIGTADGIWLIDPLAIDDLEPLWAMLATTPLVLHAGRQDLEVSWQASGRLPSTVLDTQVMAGLAGYAPQIGYAALVKTLLDIELDKSKTRTDWSRRPLDADELAYAAADVAHLGDIRALLDEKLASLGRQTWAREDTLSLLEPALYNTDTSEAWRRVKGLSRLAPSARRSAMALARWREQTAVEKNLPRQWVLRDSELLAIAERYRFDGRAPQGFENAATERRYARKIQRFLDENRDTLPEPAPPSPRPDPTERELVKRLGKAVAARAAELGVEPEVLAPMRELRSSAKGERDLRVFSGWRRRVVGDALLAVLG